MTAHSELGYYVDMAVTANFTEDSPCSVDAALNMVNNLRHLHDEGTQYLVNWTARDESHAIGKNIGTTWECLVSTLIPVYIRLDGSPSDLIVRVAYDDGASNGTGGVQVKYNIVHPDRGYQHDDNAVYASTSAVAHTATSPAWNIDNEHEFTPSTTLLAIQDLERTRMSFSTEATNAGGADAEVELYMWRFDLWAKDDDGSTFIWGLQIRQFIGD